MFAEMPKLAVLLGAVHILISEVLAQFRPAPAQLEQELLPLEAGGDKEVFELHATVWRQGRPQGVDGFERGDALLQVADTLG